MAEYIERESVHELIERLEKYQMFNYDRSQSIVGISPDDVNFGVDKIPSADVAPVRHGRWEKFSTSNGIISRVRCSCCAGTQPLTFENMPYCPSCGARMDKEADHEVSEP